MNYIPENLQPIIEEVSPAQQIAFSDVWLDYTRQESLFLKPPQSETEKLVESYALRRLSLKIPPGQMIAFCGRTGSGKSSVLSLIFKLYQPTRGQIILGESDDSDVQSWRQHISVIPQSGFLFKGTVLENLVPDLDPNKITFLMEQIKEVPTDIELGAEIESGGKNISQGKRQVITFLRVLLEKANIICLDEATASVDQAIEDWTMNKLTQLSKQQGKTIITISHRLEQLKNYDMIYCLEDGMIVEQGTFDELVHQPFSKLNKLRNIN